MDLMRTENDRRSKFRFALVRDVRYKLAENKVVVAAGSGHTMNMSSGGVAFLADQPLTVGGYVELSISWPALLDASCPMRLIAFGRVLRCSGRKVVCSIDKYEFRTQARAVQAPAPTRGDGMLHRWVDGVRKEGYRVTAARV